MRTFPAFGRLSCEELRALAPEQPRYLDPGREPGRLIQEWNLIVLFRAKAAIDFGSPFEIPESEEGA